MLLRRTVLWILFLGLLLPPGCASPEASPSPTVAVEPELPEAVPEATEEATVAPTPTSPSTPEGLLAITSPDERLALTFFLLEGVPHYAVEYDGDPLLLPSRLGLAFSDAPSLNANLRVVQRETRTFDEVWEQPWGEVREIRNHYNELRVELEAQVQPSRSMVVAFRLYDDGLGFRYELPEGENLGDFEIVDEETTFVLTGDHLAWWTPAYERERYEYLYRRTPLSGIDAEAVHTPLTMETAEGLYLSFHEAALTDYASMTLAPTEDHTLACDLVPWGEDGIKVRGSTPHRSPWRTLQVAERPGDLITSYLILNLNEPNALADTSWIEPGKYVGIWWGMHVGKYTWEIGPNHGATTENAKFYIDFAAEHGIPYVLIEGWNVGWDGDWMNKGTAFDFTTPYPDFDLEEVAAYATERGVGIIGHHETGSNVSGYEAQLEEAFALYQSLGIDAVKTGYVGWGQGIKRRNEEGRVVGLEWHHGQFMVRHYRHVVETAARFGIMLNVHEPVKPTGIRRTYPNMMTREGARGQEYNAWSEGNGPEHTTVLPFTRMLAGPLDFTPGIFDLTFDAYKDEERVPTTLAKQLALYVVLYSPLQMVADLPENYAGHPAFRFIEVVPVDWGETLVLDGAVGDYVTIVRRERGGDEWYLGSITDEAGRTLEASLTFLEPDVPYVAEIYADAPGAHWRTNPHAYEIREELVDAETVPALNLAPGGGQAIRFRPATDDDLARLGE